MNVNTTAIAAFFCTEGVNSYNQSLTQYMHVNQIAFWELEALYPLTLLPLFAARENIRVTTTERVGRGIIKECSTRRVKCTGGSDKD